MSEHMQETIAPFAIALGMSSAGRSRGLRSHQIVSELERGQRDVKAWELARIADVLHTSSSR